MTWPPVIHQDVQDEVTALRKGAPNQFVAGLWYTSVDPSMSGTMLATEGTVWWSPVVIRNGAVNGLAIRTSSTNSASGATLALGLYDSDPATLTPRNLLASASVAAPSTSNTNVSVTIPDTAVAAGLHWIAALATGATPSLIASGAAGFHLLAIGLDSIPTSNYAGYSQAGQSALPAAAAATAVTGTAPVVVRGWYKMAGVG